MSMSIPIAIHATAACAALVLGPFALWSREGRAVRPRLHRAFGYAWVTLMIATALSALFIRYDSPLPNLWGYSPIHLLVPVTLWNLYAAFAALARGDLARHRSTMKNLYYGACVTAGLFALLPMRALGRIVWGSPWGFVIVGGLIALVIVNIQWRKSSAARFA